MVTYIATTINVAILGLLSLGEELVIVYIYTVIFGCLRCFCENDPMYPFIHTY